MNYYKLDINSIFASLFITSIFFSDFGIVIFGQAIFLNQILAFGFLIYFIGYSSRIEKYWALFFLAVIISLFANISILLESRKWAGDTYPWTSIKNLLNIIIFYAVYKTTLFSYNKINPNLLYYLSIIMVLYGVVEILFGSYFSPYKSDFVIKILQFFHTNKDAPGHYSLSLLGREHSYGSLGYNIVICFMISFYLNKVFRGFKSLLVIPLILMLLYISILTNSKTGLISLILLALLLIFLIIKNKKLNLKLFLISFLSLIFLTFLILNFIDQGFLDDITDSILNDIGSGSTFIRWTSLRISWAIFLDNFFWGIGGGNFKLFYFEYVELLNIPIILEVKDYFNPNNTNIPNQLNFFAGILSEFGFFTFILVFYFIFKKIIYLFFSKKINFQTTPIAILITPIIFSASFSLYYWAISFFPFYLALLHIEYIKVKKNN